MESQKIILTEEEIRERDLNRIKSMESVKTLDDLARRDEAILLDIHITCPPDLQTIDPLSAISGKTRPNPYSKGMIMARLNDEVQYTRNLLSWIRKYQERISDETWKIGTTPEMLFEYSNEAIGDLKQRVRKLRRVNTPEKEKLRELVRLHGQLHTELDKAKFTGEAPDGMGEFLSSPELRVPSDSEATEMTQIYKLRPSAISMISRGFTMGEDTAIVTLDRPVFDLAMNILHLYEGKTLPWAPEFKLDEDTRLLINNTSMGFFYFSPQKNGSDYSLNGTFVGGF